MVDGNPIPTNWTVMFGLDQDKLTKHVLAKPSHFKLSTNLTNYKDQIIFVSGGSVRNHFGEIA